MLVMLLLIGWAGLIASFLTVSDGYQVDPARRGVPVPQPPHDAAPEQNHESDRESHV